MLKTFILSFLLMLSSAQCPIGTLVGITIDGEPVTGMEAQVEITPEMTTGEPRPIPDDEFMKLFAGCPKPHLFAGTLPLKLVSEGVWNISVATIDTAKVIICEGTPDLIGYTRRFPFVLLLAQGPVALRFSFTDGDGEVLAELFSILKIALRNYGRQCTVPMFPKAFDSFLESKTPTVLHDFGCKFDLDDLKPFIEEQDNSNIPKINLEDPEIMKLI